jgi:undecaprenyl-diphosphatase
MTTGVPPARRAPGTPPIRPGAVTVRLAITLLLLLASTVGAGWLLTRAKEGDAFERADGAFVRWLAVHRTGLLDTVSAPVAELGNTGVVVGIAVGVAIILAVLRRWRSILFLAVALVGELAVFLATTVLVDRRRPPVPHLDSDLPPTSSFPSGHTAAAICLYGCLAALVLSAARMWWRWLAVVLAVLVVLAVGLARLYRGAHYPTDVLGSLLFAVPWLLVVLRVTPPDRGGSTWNARWAP